MTKITTTRQCVECEREFDLTDETDAEEWSYGHDCETAPDPRPAGGWLDAFLADVDDRHAGTVRADVDGWARDLAARASAPAVHDDHLPR